MQVFMPFGLNRNSMNCLDNKRLGKQRVECLQILNALQGKSKGWRHHPATLMFYGAEEALKIMGDWAIAEWIRRGYTNNMEPFSHHPVGIMASVPPEFWPEWWCEEDLAERVIESHKLNLLKKDYNHYYRKFSIHSDLIYSKRDIENAQYVWPVTKEDIQVKEVLSLCP